MHAKSLHLLIGSIVIAVVLSLVSGTVWAQETAVETPTETPTVVPADTPTPTSVPVETDTETPTPIPTDTPTATATTPPAATDTPVPTETQTETPTPVPTDTPVPVPTDTPVPTETETETPTVVPSDTPIPAPTDTPVPTETETETPTAVPSDTPVPAPTDTPVPTETETETPTEEPTATPIPVSMGLSVGSVEGKVNDRITIPLAITNAVDVDAFGFDIIPSADVLSFVQADKTGTLTNDFFLITANTLTGTINVRVSGVGGPAVVNGDGVLLNLIYTITAAEPAQVTLNITNLVDDLAGAQVTPGIVTITSETPVDTPTPTETPVTETDTPTPTVAPTDTPVPTDTPEPTATPSESPTETPIPTDTPTATATPTAPIVNPNLGIVAVDELGGTYPIGNAVHNFDIGYSDPKTGYFLYPGLYDGLPDPNALGPYLIVNFLTGGQGVPIPIAKDMEFSGETLATENGGNGSEGAYFLIGGTIGTYPPVSGRLGALGGENRGGIDYNKDGKTDLNFGFFKSDIIPVGFNPPATFDGIGTYETKLVDLEPAGNSGFYVLDKSGSIMAEGSANPALEANAPITTGSVATALKIFRDKAIDLGNSQFAPAGALVGKGAYVLDSYGKISVIGDAPNVVTTDIPLLAGTTVEATTPIFVDMEFMPNPEGTEFIGLMLLVSCGHTYFAPFEGVTVDVALQEFVVSVMPIKPDGEDIPGNLARDIELDMHATTDYGLDTNMRNVEYTGTKIGFFLFDGFGGSYIGGDATWYAAAYMTGDRVIEGLPVKPFLVAPPFFGVDAIRDVELALPVKR